MDFRLIEEVNKEYQAKTRADNLPQQICATDKAGEEQEK
jgi:hypothetical protein